MKSIAIYCGSSNKIDDEYKKEAIKVGTLLAHKKIRIVYGVRYLAQGDVGLVRDAARERQVLREIAPHLTRRTGFLLPTRSAAGLAKFRTAMWTFEKLGKVPKEDHHEVLDFDDLLEQEPLAATEGTTGAVRYIEFVTDDSRLTLANARSAASHGCLIYERILMELHHDQLCISTRGIRFGALVNNF